MNDPLAAPDTDTQLGKLNTDQPAPTNNPLSFASIISTYDSTLMDALKHITGVFESCGHNYDSEVLSQTNTKPSIAFSQNKKDDDSTFRIIVNTNPNFQPFRDEIERLSELTEISLSVQYFARRASKTIVCAIPKVKQKASNQATKNKSTCGHPECDEACLFHLTANYDLHGMDRIYLIPETNKDKTGKRLNRSYIRHYITTGALYLINNIQHRLIFVGTRKIYQDTTFDYDKELIGLYTAKFTVTTTDDHKLLIDGEIYSDIDFLHVFSVNENGEPIRKSTGQSDAKAMFDHELPKLENLGAAATPEQSERRNKLKEQKDKYDAEKAEKKLTEQTSTLGIHGVQTPYTTTYQNTSLNMDEYHAIAAASTKLYRDEHKQLNGRQIPILADNQLTINSTYGHMFSSLNHNYARAATNLGYKFHYITQSNSRLQVDDINDDIKGQNFKLMTSNDILTNFKSMLIKQGINPNTLRAKAAIGAIHHNLVEASIDISKKGQFGRRIKNDKGVTTHIETNFDYTSFIDLCYDPLKYTREHIKYLKL